MSKNITISMDEFNLIMKNTSIIKDATYATIDHESKINIRAHNLFSLLLNIQERNRDDD